MELQTLDDDFQPNIVIENYETLIWTERYATASEFVMTFNDISTALALLPEGTYVTLRDTMVPMKVEDHKIEKKKNAVPVLTVTGRAFEICALEQRQALNHLPTVGPRNEWTITADKESDAAFKAIRAVIGDVEQFQSGVSVLPAVSPALSPLDAIPEIKLTLPLDYSTLTTNTYQIDPKGLLDLVLELIGTNHRGIKSVRPDPSSNQVSIEIYNGADLTESVVFDARFDQIDEATYLLTKAGSKNVAYVYGPNGSQQVLKNAGPEPSGLDRRVMYVDDGGSTTETRYNRGLVELYKNNPTALFDGQVAEQVAKEYNHSYFLGDILMLTGQYGLSENVRVAEFIRSSDNTGTKAYPTFEAVTS